MEEISGEPTRDWYSNETATFGDRLADARLALGLSAEELARSIGVKAATLEKWENDTSEPAAGRLSHLAELLNVSLRWLMTGEGEGLSEPASEVADEDTVAILTEMRALQRDVVRCADRLGRLEKRLRLAGRP